LTEQGEILYVESVFHLYIRRMNNESTQLKTSEDQKNKDIFGTIMLAILAIILIVAGIIPLIAFYYLQFGTNTWLPGRAPDAVGKLGYSWPGLLFALVFLYGAFNVIKAHRKPTSEATPANALFLHPYFRQGLFYGSLLGGLFVFELSQFLNHKYDNEISIALIILSVYAAFSFSKLKKPSTP
jgi:hypothetical protein